MERAHTVRITNGIAVATLALIGTICVGVQAAPASSGKDDPLKPSRAALSAQDFAGALRHLAQVPKPDRATFGAYRVEAVAHIGLALQASNRTDDAMVAVSLASGMSKFLADQEVSTPGASFLRDIKKHISEFNQSSVPSRDAVLRDLREIGQESLRARVAAESAVAAAKPEERERASVLTVWTETFDHLACADINTYLRGQAAVKGASPAQLEPLKPFVSGDRKPENSELRLRKKLLPVLQQAGSSRSPLLALALAEGLRLHCAASGRLMRDPYTTGMIRYSMLHAVEAPEPEGGFAPPIPLPQQPATVLATTGQASLSTSPEALLLPLYLHSVALDKGAQVPASAYQLHLLLLEVNDRAAGDAMANPHWKALGATRAAFALERARYALLYRHRPEEALQWILEAIRAGHFRREISSSFPLEAQPLWFRSRYVRTYDPQFALPYTPLFQLLDRIQADATRSGKPALPTISTRLRLAELIAQSNLPYDALAGLEEAKNSLALFEKSPGLSDEQRAQIQAYRARIAETDARLPALRDGVLIRRSGIVPVARGNGSVSESAVIIRPSGQFIYLDNGP